MEGNAQEEGGPLRWHMSRGRQRWVRTESASLEWRLDQGAPKFHGPAYVPQGDEQVQRLLP